MINHVMINKKRTSPPKTICLGDEVLVVPPQVHRNVAIPVSSSPFPFILRTVLNPVLYIGSTRSTIPHAARFVPADRSEACFNAVFSPILSIRALCIKNQHLLFSSSRSIFPIIVIKAKMKVKPFSFTIGCQIHDPSFRAIDVSCHIYIPKT